ncbi:LysE family transporter [Pseudoalteromonas spongiae]|uniref:LysE family transporter n=1 Tax=Pseudoalteromonas spongiae TaxID=298657 RepID=UPI003735D8A8
MNYLDEFLLIAISHFFAVASPGPDFALVLKQSIQKGRNNALVTSAGIATGILVHVSYCVLGVAIVIAQSPAVFAALKYLAAAYLAYIGVMALRAKPADQQAQQVPSNTQAESMVKAFSRGFLVNALNPKATLFFLSLFTLVISVETPIKVQVGYGLYMAVATLVWFSFLSIVLSRSKVRAFFLRAGHWFDRGIGVVLIGLAIRVVWV